MISFLYKKLQQGVTYVTDHPNLLLVCVLILILPLLLWYSNQQYIDAGKENLDRTQKDRIGLLQDVFASLLIGTNYSPASAQIEIERLTSSNPDIEEFIIAKAAGPDVLPIAAHDTALIGLPDKNPQFYKNALVRPDESMIFPTDESGKRQWYVYRAIESTSGDTYFIYTKLSLAAVDSAFASNVRSANWSFFYLYVAIAAFAYWHIKMTDYRYLYTQVHKANEMKDLFTNMIAHELRAPLTAIRGYASMMEEKTEGENRSYANRVRESSERLLSIVNDLLDVARLQSGKLAVSSAKVDSTSIVAKVLEELSITGSEKSVTLKLEGNPAPHYISVDPKRFHQALTNLVNNAIKYTKQGSISVSIEDKYEFTEIRVKDTGMGIASEDQQKLFAPFFRVASDDVGKITGTGLGMLITKQLIELMGGHIAVESIKGVGTHVVVTFPKLTT